MTPLPADQLRVWRRPGALLAFWAFRLLAAWVVVSPLVDAVAATGIGRHPHGDAALFEPGGLFLFESARLALPALGAAAGTTGALLFLAAVAGLYALASLMVALAHGDRLRFGVWGSAAVQHFPAFLVLAGVAWVLQGLLFLAAALLFSLVHGVLGARVEERTADLSALGATLGVVLAMLAASVLHDLARAAVVRHRVGAGSGARIAWRAARSSPRALLLAWSWPALAGVATVFAAAIAVDRLAVENAGSTRTSLAWLVHQSAAFALVALRATWLVAALRAVAGAEPQFLSRSRRGSAGIPEGSAALADPSSDPGA